MTKDKGEGGEERVKRWFSFPYLKMNLGNVKSIYALLRSPINRFTTY
jgi:hypothetical protein